MRRIRNGLGLLAAALFVALGGGAILSLAPAVDAAAPLSDVAVAPGLFCEAPTGAREMRPARDCAAFEIVNGRLVARPPDSDVEYPAAVAALSDQVLLIEASRPRGDAESARDYRLIVAVATPDAFIQIELREIAEADKEAAAARAVELRSSRRETLGAFVVAGAPEEIRAWVGDVVAAQFERARADADSLDELLEGATIAVRAGPADAVEPSASVSEIAASRREAVAALRTAVLSFDLQE